ncbi:MAG: hypothetical protein KDC49_02775 [Saprospiraceae bacterium]|nr:hypothetical protein [Saprospiraceae bacterium]
MKHLNNILFVLFICIGLKASATQTFVPKLYDSEDHVEASIAPMPIQDVNNAEKVETPLVTNNYKNDLNPTKRLFKKPSVRMPELNDSSFPFFNLSTGGAETVFFLSRDIPVLFKKLTI